MRGIFQKENANKARKYGIYRHLPTYEKIIRNLVSFYDINFRESLDIIEEQNYIPKIIARIPYTNPETKEVMKRVEEELIEYARIGLISSCP